MEEWKNRRRGRVEESKKWKSRRSERVEEEEESKNQRNGRIKQAKRWKNQTSKETEESKLPRSLRSLTRVCGLLGVKWECNAWGEFKVLFPPLLSLSLSPSPSLSSSLFLSTSSAHYAVGVLQYAVLIAVFPHAVHRCIPCSSQYLSSRSCLLLSRHRCSFQ